jgi:hypothetical protein
VVAVSPLTVTTSVRPFSLSAYCRSTATFVVAAKVIRLRLLWL